MAAPSVKEEPSLLGGCAESSDTTNSDRGGADPYRPPCTASDDQACRINNYLPFFNEFLFNAYLQLRELPGTHGLLTIASLNECEPNLTCPSDFESHKTSAFLRWLLRTHVCVVGYDLDFLGTVRHGPTFWEIPPQQSTLKRIKLEFIGGTSDTHFAATLPCLTSLEELECRISGTRTDDLVTSLATLLPTTSCLTSLKLEKVFLDGELAKRFVDALAANSSLKFLNLSFYSAAADETGSTARNAKTARLREGWSIRDATVSTMLLGEAILANRRLSTLRIDAVFHNERWVELLSQILTECDALTKLTIDAMKLWRVRIPKSTFKRCVKALVENKTLEELALPYGLWSPRKWITLFAFLPQNKCLKKLHVSGNDTMFCGRVHHVLEALEQSESSSIVSFGANVHGYRLDLVKFGALSNIELRCPDNVTLTALERLPTLPHFTSLSLEISERNVTLFTSLAKYIGETTVLRELGVDVRKGGAPTNAVPPCQTLLCDAIKRNASIRTLTVTTGSSKYEECLADTISRSRNITRVKVVLGDFLRPATEFVSRLSRSIEENHTLLEVILLTGELDAEGTRCWLSISQATRRNAGLVARASSAFSRTARLDWYNAAALEELSRHQALVRELADRKGIAAHDMARMVRSRLRSVEGLDDYMRLTRVVKEQVTCAPPVDDRGGMQLQDLNSDCWAMIRQYLSFDDVKCTGLTKAQNFTSH
ncbi:uncharacterized protein [Dermacentor albipictus]|uniref:uncharacterized protein n=1 Tax=Dermacentor albipictus TaxID=60249 RepID=UPI0038FD26DF